MASVDTSLRAASLEGELLCGQYLVEALIGEGGMAWVYKAVDTRSDEPVAVKVLREHRQRSESGEARFLREAEIQAQLKHPHIVQVHRVFEERGIVGFVQEWCAGGDLHKLLLEHQGPLSNERLERLFLPLLDAVAYAHDEGLIHRDIKPANILLNDKDSELVKLNDFGLVKVLALDSLTSTGTVMGTVHYMAPEQFEESKDVDHRADIYSLGVLLYELSTGRLPFTGRMPALGMKIIKSEPPPPREAPFALHAVLARCLAKRPHARYQDCRAMQRAVLDALQQPEPSIETAPMGSSDAFSPVMLARATPLQASAHTSGQLHQKTPFGGRLQHTMGVPTSMSEPPEEAVSPMSTTDALAQAWPHNHSPETAPTFPLEALKETPVPEPPEGSFKGLLVLLLLGFGIGIAGALYIQHQRSGANVDHPITRRRPLALVNVPRDRRPVPAHRRHLLGTDVRPGPTASKQRTVVKASAAVARRGPVVASIRPPAPQALGPSGPVPSTPPRRVKAVPGSRNSVPTNPAGVGAPATRRTTPDARDVRTTPPRQVPRPAVVRPAPGKLPVARRQPSSGTVGRSVVPRGPGSARPRPTTPRPIARSRQTAGWGTRRAPLLARVPEFRLQPKGRSQPLDRTAGLFRMALAHETRKELTKARQLLQQVCDRKMGAACARLAWFTCKGMGGPKVPKQGIALFEKACRLGHTLSCYQLGLAYREGLLGQVIDQKKARHWFGIACQKGKQPACVRLGMMLWGGDGGARQRKRAMSLFKVACEKKDGTGCRAVSYLYFRKLKQDPNRYQIGRKYARKGCLLNESASCVKLGEAFYLGRGGPKDYRKAFHFFLKGCKLQHGAGCYYLAGALSRGLGTKRQPKKALHYAKLSCKLKDEDGCHVLGRLYSQGVGAPRDCKLANAAYHKACQLGEKTACREFCVEQKPSPFDTDE